MWSKRRHLSKAGSHTLRTRSKRLIRQTIGFSKITQMHDIVLGLCASIDMPLDCLSQMVISTFRTLPELTSSHD
jgi:hypothetical protein